MLLLVEARGSGVCLGLALACLADTSELGFTFGLI